MRIPIAFDAWRFVLPLAVVAGFLFWIDRWWSIPWAILAVLAAAFCLCFFRDFDRRTVIDERFIYSPGDGKVLEVSSVKDGDYQGWMLIRIFLSVLDVHVQRSPAEGRVAKIRYTKGLFLDARHPQAHLQNEQNEVTLLTRKGTLVVTQIAGLIARRIVCWCKEGETLGQGQRYGLIRFGSQVDVLTPPNGARPKIQVGDRVVGGETVIAEWGS